jgi:hypothetical protein
MSERKSTIECPRCQCKITTYGPMVQFENGTIRYDPPFEIETCPNCGWAFSS